MTAVTTLIMAIPIDRIIDRTTLARFEPLYRQLQIHARNERTYQVLARLFAAILPLLPAIDRIEQSSYCRPEAMHSAAIIRLRLAEEAITNAERDAIDTRLGALQNSIVKSLACAPSDPFLWAILTWLDQTRQGFRPQQLMYLRLSYRLGPYEGWIADRRNRLALSMFWRLPPDLAEAVVREFATMVNSQFYEVAIAILTGPGWPLHDQLLAGLKDSDPRQREEFAKALYSAGYDVSVPGIGPSHDRRPW
jgi:hypothetical protein